MASGFAGRVIIIELESPDPVMAWYNCLEYRAIARSDRPTPLTAPLVCLGRNCPPQGQRVGVADGFKQPLLSATPDRPSSMDRTMRSL
jgi:hypothetical protein